jgi:HSP20 family protein
MANALQEREKNPAPARALESVRRDFDELIDRFFGTRPRSTQRFQALLKEPAIESFIEGDKLVVHAEMPGIDPKDVEVKVSGNMLTIRAKREERHEEKDRDFLQREISYDEMERSIVLPPGTTGEDIKATFKNGMLELAIPIPKELATQRVEVQIENGGGNGAKREEAKHK